MLPRGAFPFLLCLFFTEANGLTVSSVSTSATCSAEVYLKALDFSGNYLTRNEAVWVGNEYGENNGFNLGCTLAPIISEARFAHIQYEANGLNKKGSVERNGLNEKGCYVGPTKPAAELVAGDYSRWDNPRGTPDMPTNPSFWAPGYPLENSTGIDAAVTIQIETTNGDPVVTDWLLKDFVLNNNDKKYSCGIYQCIRTLDCVSLCVDYPGWLLNNITGCIEAYGIDGFHCELDGELMGTHGLTGNQACCVCGGGNNVVPGAYE